MTIYFTPMGGFANQAIQFLAACRLADVRGKNEEVIASLSFMNSQHKDQGFTVRQYSLGELDVPPKTVDHLPLAEVHLLEWEETSGHEAHENVAMSGYFQDLAFLPDRERSLDLLMPKPEIARMPIPLTMFASVHFRRGDYVANPNTNAFHGVCELDYYRRAANVLKANSRFLTKDWYGFSDDNAFLEEARLQLHNDMPYLQTAHGASLSDVAAWWRMAQADAFIIANSSYSWLAAWVSLSNDVVYPKRWFRDRASPNLFPKEWLAVE